MASSAMASSDNVLRKDRTKQLISTFINPELSSVEQEQAIVELASVKQLLIPDLIEHIGEELTSLDDKIRNRATLLLAELLHRTVGISSFSSTILHLFVVFFARRLDDYPSIVPSLHALTAIVRYYFESLDPKHGDIPEIFTSIFTNIHLQSYAQNIRQRVLELFQEILSQLFQFNQQQLLQQTRFFSSHVNASTAKSILLGSIDAMENEKDPRCLLKSLQVLTQANHIFASQANKEILGKLFDAVAVYFPITFSPPPDDPFGITSEMLVNSLEETLTSHEKMGDRLIPFLLDQLNSTEDNTTTAKLYAMRCLTRFYSTYDGLSVLQSLEDCSSILLQLREAMLENVLSTQLPPSISDSSDTFLRVECIKFTAMFCVDIIKSFAAGHGQRKGNLLWEIFAEAILQRIVKEFEENMDGLHSRILSQIAIAIVSCTSSNLFVGQVLVDRLFPVALERATYVMVTVRDRLQSEIDNANKIYSLSSSDKDIEQEHHHSHDQSQHSVTNDSSSGACGSQPSSGCCGGSNHIDHNHSHSHNHSSSLVRNYPALHQHLPAVALEFMTLMLQSLPKDGVDYSTLKELHPLTNQLGAMITMLSLVFNLQKMNANVDNKHWVDEGSVLSQQCTHKIIVESIRCLSEVLLRSNISSLALQIMPSTTAVPFCVKTYISQLTNLAVFGPQALLFDSARLSWTTSRSSTSISPVTQAAESALAELSRHGREYLPVICDHSLPLLFSQLIDNKEMASVDQIKLLNLLSSMGQHDSSATIMQSCLPDLLSVLEGPQQTRAPASSVEVLKALADMLSTTSTRSRISLKSANGKKVALLTKPLDSLEMELPACMVGSAGSLIEALVVAVLRGNITTADEGGTVVEALTQLVQRTIESMPTAETATFASLLVQRILNERLYNATASSTIDTGDAHVRVTILTLSLVYAVVSSIDKQSQFFQSRQSNQVSVLDECVAMAFREARTSLSASELAGKVLASIVFKISSSDTRLQEVYIKLKSCLQSDDCLEESRRMYPVNLCMYIAHAYYIRLDLPAATEEEVKERMPLSVPRVHLQDQVSDLLLGLLTSRNVSSSSMGALVGSKFHLLTAAPVSIDGGNTNAFWRQRLWTRLFPRLIAAQADSAGATSVQSQASFLPVLVAICGLNVSMPYAVVASSSNGLQQVVDLVVRALVISTTSTVGEAGPESIKAAGTVNELKPLLLEQAISSLETLLKENPAALATMASTIVPTLLQVSVKDRKAKIRATALMCLVHIARLPFATLYPLKKAVVKELLMATNDKKQIIRMLAAKVRNMWMVLSK